MKLSRLLAVSVLTKAADVATETKIRLVNGPTVNEGRIEIEHEGEWGTVCDDSYNLNTAHVFCRMLGYTRAENYHHSARWGKGDGRIWLDEVKCNGDEYSIKDCTHNGWGVTDCEHHEDAGVLCHTERIPGFDIAKLREAQIFDDAEFHIRLAPLQRHREQSYNELGFITMGTLEMLGDDQKWRMVCANNWSEHDSRVACGQLGFSHVGVVPGKIAATMKRRRAPYGMHSVKCTGAENNLIWCEKELLGEETGFGRCPGKKPVVLACRPGRMYIENIYQENSTSDQKIVYDDKILFSRSRQPPGLNIRLKAGGNIGSGRVEVKVDHQWGTICHENWSVESANVVCRELGFGSAKSAFKDSQFGNGHGPVYWSNVNCTGFEAKLEQCAHEALADATEYQIRTRPMCNHGHDVSVECNTPKLEQRATMQVRLSGGRHFREGRIEVKVNGQWGAVCSNDFSMNNAVVICRQLGFGYAHQFVSNLHYWKEGPDGYDGVLMSGLKCEGDEMSIQQCKFDENISCPSKYNTPYTGLVCTERAGDLVIDIPLLESSLHLSRVSTGTLQCAAEENCLSPTAYLTEWYDQQYWDPYRTRNLLRFSTRVWNRGTADFLPKAARNQWEWHACHAHYHSMESFIDYDILSLNRTKVAFGHKASFCLEDNDCEGEADRQYDCDRTGGGEQGISMGCADTYLYTLDCQWIDITDVPPGNYLLRLHANPGNQVAETDFYNNIGKAVCNIILEENSIFAFNCHIPDDYEETFIKQFYTARAYVGRKKTEQGRGGR